MLKPQLIFFLLLCISCKNNGQSKHSLKDSVAAQTAKTIAGNFSNQQTIKFDAEKITVFFKIYPQLTSIKKELDSFYFNRQYAYAWFDDKGLIEHAANLYNHIQNRSSEGVVNKLFYKTKFASLMEVDKADSLNVNTEIMLTAHYFLYAKNVWTGLSEKETQSINWYAPRKKIAYSLLLNSLIVLTGKSPAMKSQFFISTIIEEESPFL